MNRRTVPLVLAVLLAQIGVGSARADLPDRPAAPQTALATDFGYIASWGAWGSADGKFNAIRDVATGFGDVLTVESGNQRVQRFTTWGGFLMKWGNPGPGGSSLPGRFSGPSGIAVSDDGYVYVADEGNDRVQKFTSEGVLEEILGVSSPGTLNAPFDVAVDEDGNVYVADFGNSEGGEVGYSRIAKFDSNGTWLGSFGDSGSGDGQFGGIDSVAVSAGVVYVSDPDNDRVQRYSLDGVFLGNLGTTGTGPGQFLAPSGMAVGPDGSIWVADRDRADVQQFSASGELLVSYGPGEGAGRLEGPTGIAVDPDGFVYVADNFAERVVKIGDRGSESTDTDGDGLMDRWEIMGLDVNGDEVVDVDLPRMGASFRHKDVFLEIDHLVNHALTARAIDEVRNSFSVAPVTNPDGRIGIALHVDNGADSVMTQHGGFTWGPRSGAQTLTHANVIGSFSGGDYDWSAFDTIKHNHFAEARERVFHYVVSGHRYGSWSNTSSGISRGIVGADLLVTLQGFCAPLDCSGTDAQQTGTLMHELGHNLGLRHGGDDNTNRKPNYLSIMNYTFQMGGLVMDGRAGLYDYSRFPPTGTPGATDTLSNLDESALDDSTGFGAVGTWVSRFTAYPYRAGWYAAAVTGPLDWNGDGTEDVEGMDVNSDGARTILTTFDDWAHIVYDGGAVGDALGVEPVPAPPVTERNEAPKSVLIEMAQVVTGDRSRPTIRATTKKLTNRVKVIVKARDNVELARVILQVDKKTRTWSAIDTRTRTVRLTVRGKGRHQVTVSAIDAAGNIARTQVLKFRIR
jgi:sugar lactone lactonase YvrE